MGVVSRRWVWLVGVGEIYGCGCKEVYTCIKISSYYLSLLLLYLFFFAAASLLFVPFFMFFVLVPVLFCNYILCIK